MADFDDGLEPLVSRFTSSRSANWAISFNQTFSKAIVYFKNKASIEVEMLKFTFWQNFQQNFLNLSFPNNIRV